MGRWKDGLFYNSALYFLGQRYSFKTRAYQKLQEGILRDIHFESGGTIFLFSFDEQGEKSTLNAKKELHLNARKELWSSVVTWCAGNTDESKSIAMYRSEDEIIVYQHLSTN